MQSSLRARLQSWQHAVPFAPRLQRIARLRRVAAGTEDGHGGDASLGGLPASPSSSSHAGKRHSQLNLGSEFGVVVIRGAHTAPGTLPTRRPSTDEGQQLPPGARGHPEA